MLEYKVYMCNKVILVTWVINLGFWLLLVFRVLDNYDLLNSI
jgi:hypothetical protein